jgi:hypothetical protein
VHDVMRAEERRGAGECSIALTTVRTMCSIHFCLHLDDRVNIEAEASKDLYVDSLGAE